MAATSVTILLEMANEFRFTANLERLTRYKFTLEHAKGLEIGSMDYDDWILIRDEVIALIAQLMEESRRVGTHIDECRADSDYLMELIILALGRCIAEWEQLGCPPCLEDWIKAKYPKTEEVENA